MHFVLDEKTVLVAQMCWDEACLCGVALVLDHKLVDHHNKQVLVPFTGLLHVFDISGKLFELPVLACKIDDLNEFSLNKSVDVIDVLARHGLLYHIKGR